MKLRLLLFLSFLIPTLGTAQSTALFPAQSFTASGQTGTVMSLGSTSTTASGYSVGTVSLTGTALTTATISVMGSSDNGATFYALPIATVASPTTAATTTVTATASGLYQVNLAGITHVKFVTSGTFTGTSIGLALTASPVGQISKGPSGGNSQSASINPTGLLAYDFFDATDYSGGTGTVAHDQSGNGNNCTIVLGSQLSWGQAGAAYALNWANTITSSATQMINCTGITTPYAVSLILKCTNPTVGMSYFLGYSTGSVNWTAYSQVQATGYSSFMNIGGSVSSATIPVTYNMLTINLTPNQANNTVYQNAQNMPSLVPSYYLVSGASPSGGYLKIGGLATSLAPTGASAGNMSLVGYIVYGTPGVTAAIVQQNFATAAAYFATRGVDITQRNPRLNAQQNFNVNATGSSIDAGFSSQPPSSYMTLGTTYTVNNSSVSSSGTVTRDLTLASTELNNTNPRAGRNVLFVGAPTNDMCEGPIYLYSGNSTPALSWAGMLSLANKALNPAIPGATRYDTVILGTMISRTGNATYTSPPTCEVAKGIYNNLARSSALPPGVVLGDIAEIAVLGADGANSGTVGTITPVCPGATTYFNNDCVHPNTTGSALYGAGMQAIFLANTGYTKAFPNTQDGTTYTMVPGDRAMLLDSAAAANQTLTLPSCQALTTYDYTSTNASTFTITVAAQGSDTIVGSTSIPTLTSATYRAMLLSTVTGGCYWLRQ